MLDLMFAVTGLEERAHRAVSHPVYRIFEVKHQHRKVENQIKMAKMVLMNELNKQANGLIEELEVNAGRWVRWMGSGSPWLRNQAHIKLVPELKTT